MTRDDALGDANYYVVGALLDGEASGEMGRGSSCLQSCANAPTMGLGMTSRLGAFGNDLGRGMGGGFDFCSDDVGLAETNRTVERWEVAIDGNVITARKYGVAQSAERVKEYNIPWTQSCSEGTWRNYPWNPMSDSLGRYDLNNVLQLRGGASGQRGPRFFEGWQKRKLPKQHFMQKQTEGKFVTQPSMEFWQNSSLTGIHKQSGRPYSQDPNGESQAAHVMPE